MNKKKIGYAYVVADLIHLGHLKHLKRCKSQCDKLVVGILTDKATMEKKPKPIISFKERLEMVRGLRCVDEVVIQETYSPLLNAEKLKVDILFESTSHTSQSILNAKRLMERIKGKVIVQPYYFKQSSTKIKNKIIKEIRRLKND